MCFWGEWALVGGRLWCVGVDEVVMMGVVEDGL